MLKAIVTNQDKTLLLEFPYDYHQLADHLYSIGIQARATEIKCSDEHDLPYRVKVFGESEFEQSLAASVSENDSLSAVNTFWSFYAKMSASSKHEVEQSFMADDNPSLRSFGDCIIKNRQDTITEKYFCPLTVSLYPFNEYGDLDEYSYTEDGRFAAGIEDEIRRLIAREDSNIDEDLAEYFDGMNSAVAKLRSVKFGVQDVDGMLYGCIRTELTEKFTPEEENVFKDWLVGQCSDGYGEGLEQREIILNGVCITADISESPSSEDACTLSDILEKNVPEKYFLSKAAVQKILGNLSEDRRDSEFTT